MSKYKEIKGFKVQTLASDTAASVASTGTWSSGGSLNQAKKATGGAGLTPTASIVFGGVQGSPPSLATTESYNGTSWTEVNDMPQVTAFVAGVGTSTAAVAIAGIGGPSDPPKGAYVQEWNGSSWSTNPNAYPFTAYSLAGAGTATAAIISGGDPARTEVNTFDGTSFTSGTAMNTGRRGHGSVGTTTANLVVGGETPRTANTELWNGSSWTEVNNYPAATQDLSAWGTSTSAIGALGYDTANTANSASWDGTSWTETADLSTARNSAQTGGLGTNNTEGLVAGGETPGGVTAVTEEWSTTPAADFTKINLGQVYYNSGSNAFKVTAQPVAGGTWASGGTMNTTTRYFSGGAGTKTAAIGFGGQSPLTADTELYNGTSWTEVNNLNAAKSYVAGSGTQTAALCMQGDLPPVTNQVESWDGTSWTEIAENNMSKNAGNTACGTQTATLLTMRISGPAAYTEIWNGSSWTEVNDMNTAREGGGVAGISTSAIAGGGATVTNAESWDGTSWTEVSEINTARQSLGSSGAVNTSAIIFAGNRPGASSPLPGNASSPYTEFWDGTSWTEVNNLSSARYGGSSSKSGGTSGSAHAAGGYSGTAYTGITEEFTASVTNKTITVS